MQVVKELEKKIKATDIQKADFAGDINPEAEFNIVRKKMNLVEEKQNAIEQVKILEN